MQRGPCIESQSAIKQLNLGESNAVAIPGTKEEGHAKEGDRDVAGYDVKLDEHRHVVRAIVARANYISLDRPDSAFSVKELPRNMSSPTSGDREGLNRLARYLEGRPGL